MLWRFLQGTRLFQQLAEVREAQRSLRIAQHRAALRAKRAAVRSRVMMEVQHARAEQLLLHMENVRCTARIRATKQVLDAHEKRLHMLRSLAESRGERLPITGKNQTEVDFKQRILNNAESLIPAESRNAGRLVRQELRQSMEGMELKGEDEAQMSANMITGLAKDIGLSKSELEKLISQVEATGGDSGLREAVMKQFEDVPSDVTTGKRQAFQQ
ncbi:hypothetical protein BWQ96_08598 [Gracilariopsis chorda]|uniref:Uncharacterized protein n=1 Tax=Gracilariopsis chorda TaxID=448386 RepID=A0A2V3IHW9_9FLOR|nr:hypothetical protein BWQ96_08598 [Gracilariopsis chorda]|eukprot:PXF41677.1 hypothetical protein BWQ96_08598 [Gracilariopsis chorda]